MSPAAASGASEPLSASRCAPRSAQAENLAIARGGRPLLENLAFTLPSGRALVLRGPNGIGKTSLLRALAGLQPLHAGRFSLPADSAAYAGHADGLKPTLTAFENLSFWARLHARDTRAVMPALEALDLAPLAARMAGALSAGQRRRLGLARLAVTGRWLWLLDEPTVSLDAASVARFAGLIRSHLAGGGAAILATHIDLGLPEAETLDLTPFRARADAPLADPFANGEGWA